MSGTKNTFNYSVKVVDDSVKLVDSSAETLNIKINLIIKLITGQKYIQF